MNYKKAWHKLHEYHNTNTQHDWEMRELLDMILRETEEEE